MAMDSSTRRQVLSAAADVSTSNAREAAIVGGIVRSALDAGQVDVERIGRYTSAIIAEFALVNIDRRIPGGAEIAMVLDRFDRAQFPLPWSPPDVRLSPPDVR